MPWCGERVTLTIAPAPAGPRASSYAASDMLSMPSTFRRQTARELMGCDHRRHRRHAGPNKCVRPRRRLVCCPVSHRPLVFVAGLTLGDYLLWNWSLSGNHDVLAMAAGLTLPPLALATLALLALSLLRVVARRARSIARLRPRRRAAAQAAHPPPRLPASKAASRVAEGGSPRASSGSRQLAAVWTNA